MKEGEKLTQGERLRELRKSLNLTLEKFGEPQEVVSSYYMHIDHSLIIEKMKVKKIVKIASIILVTSFLIFMLWISYIRYVEFQNQFNAYSETIIQE